jgi:hypothetical protein
MVIATYMSSAGHRTILLYGCGYEAPGLSHSNAAQGKLYFAKKKLRVHVVSQGEGRYTLSSGLCTWKQWTISRRIFMPSHIILHLPSRPGPGLGAGIHPVLYNTV